MKGTEEEQEKGVYAIISSKDSKPFLSIIILKSNTTQCFIIQMLRNICSFTKK